MDADAEDQESEGPYARLVMPCPRNQERILSGTIYKATSSSQTSYHNNSAARYICPALIGMSEENEALSSPPLPAACHVPITAGPIAVLSA